MRFIKILEFLKRLKSSRKKKQEDVIGNEMIYEKNEPMKQEEKSKVKFRKNIRKEQIFINGIGLLILIIMVYFITGKYIKDEQKSSINHQERTRTQTVINHTEDAKVDEKIIFSKYSNPFIEVKTLSHTEEKRQINQQNFSNNINDQLPAIPASYISQSIPPQGFQPMNIPPVINQTLPQTKQSKPRDLQIQGILINNDVGGNMAIMSDGSIIAEGDSFQDGRIAFIGGDGITFEDGHVMQYGK